MIEVWQEVSHGSVDLDKKLGIDPKIKMALESWKDSLYEIISLYELIGAWYHHAHSWEFKLVYFIL